MSHAGLNGFGRIATRLAIVFIPPYYGRRILARMNPNGYVAPSAKLHHNNLSLGKNIFIGDNVIIFQDTGGGPVTLGDRVHFYGDTYIQTGVGGSITIGDNVYIQPGCQFSAYKGIIRIGSDVQIAPRCAFYPYDHGFSLGNLISKQPLETKGGIIIDDDAWLGYGVIVLDGVRIGKGAVVGAGSVVTRDIPDDSIAAGVPARVIGQRTNSGMARSAKL
jgi:acetyltransferase-like isoleucine patch superfamily enzyme